MKDFTLIFSAKDEKLLSGPQVAEMLGLSYNEFSARYVHRPDFPAPHFLSTARRKKWLLSSIVSWLHKDDDQTETQQEG